MSVLWVAGLLILSLPVFFLSIDITRGIFDENYRGAVILAWIVILIVIFFTALLDSRMSTSHAVTFACFCIAYSAIGFLVTYENEVGF